MTDRQLKQLSEKHKQVARLVVGGHSQTEVARLLDMHKSTISRLLRDPLVAQEIQRMQELADTHATACVPGIPEKIREGAHLGMGELIKILEDVRNDPDMLKLKANVAFELLSRAGYSPVKQVKIEQASMSMHFTPEDIEDIKKRAIESGAVIDV
nr:helix-turn-helix domain-containing protein [Bacteroidota bacterium]